MVHLEDAGGSGSVLSTGNIKARLRSVKVFLNCKISCNIKYHHTEWTDKEGHWCNLFKKKILKLKDKTQRTLKSLLLWAQRG